MCLVCQKDAWILHALFFSFSSHSPISSSLIFLSEQDSCRFDVSLPWYLLEPLLAWYHTNFTMARHFLGGKIPTTVFQQTAGSRGRRSLFHLWEGLHEVLHTSTPVSTRHSLPAGWRSFDQSSHLHFWPQAVDSQLLCSCLPQELRLFLLGRPPEWQREEGSRIYIYMYIYMYIYIYVYVYIYI